MFLKLDGDTELARAVDVMMVRAKRIYVLIINNNSNNELYLHGHKRELQHCKSILTITKRKSNNNIKLSIINCLSFLSRMIRIVPG